MGSIFSMPLPILAKLEHIIHVGHDHYLQRPGAAARLLATAAPHVLAPHVHGLLCAARCSDRAAERDLICGREVRA
jgi:hypothetical protein